MIHSRASQTVILSAAMSLVAVPQALSYGTCKVSGRVTDAETRPLKNVEVDLWEKDGELSLTTRTNRRGEFEFEHEPCGSCFLEVTAPVKTGLSQAIIEDVPGDDSRSYLVSLKRGFCVRGRVTSRGKPLKGIIVKVYSKEHKEDKKERTHGGGAMLTGRGGEFRIVLTPGEKTVVFINIRYKDVVHRREASLKVVKDITLADVELPVIERRQ